MLELSRRALAGDAQAQAQLRQIGATLRKALANPVDTVSQSIKDELALADWLDNQGRPDEATQMRSKLFSSGVLSVTGAGAVAVKGGQVIGRWTTKEFFKLQEWGTTNTLGKGSVSGTTTKFTYNAVENPGPLAEKILGSTPPAANFYAGRYNAIVLEKDLILYRAGNSEKALGQWFTRTPPSSVAQVRIDLAVRPQWIDAETGVLTAKSHIDTLYAIKIPKGTVIYEGPVGNQGGVYLGGLDKYQIYLPSPWDIPGIQVISKQPLR